MRRRATLAGTVIACTLAPIPASAHLMATGLGPVFDGVSHFGLSPEDFLPVIALGFFAGLRGPAHSRLSLATVSLLWFIGGMGAMLGFTLSEFVLSLTTAALFMLVGIMLSTNIDLPPKLCAFVGVGLGFIRGMGDLAGVGESIAHIMTLLGMTAAVFIVFSIAASLTIPLKRLWIIVAARVSGSWIAALGLLLVGWIVRYGRLTR